MPYPHRIGPFNRHPNSNRPQFPPTPPVPKPPGPITLYQPPVTPIYPRPIVPVNQPVLPRLLPSTPRRLLPPGVAGSFRAPVGAAPGISRLIPTVARRIPYVALGFLAFDGFLLACAAGLLPHSICPRPDNPAPGGDPPGFTGGQCPGDYYRISLDLTRNGGGSWEINYYSYEAKGAVMGMFSRLISSPSLTQIQYFVRHRQIDGSIIEGPGTTGNEDGKFRPRIGSVTPIYGALNNCGDLPPIPQPQRMPDTINNINIINSNPIINISIPILIKPNPNPQRTPIIIVPPSPLPDVIISLPNDTAPSPGQELPVEVGYNFNPQPVVNPNQPDFFNNFPPTPLPNLNLPNPVPWILPPVGAAPQIPSPPQIPPPLPPQIPPETTPPENYIIRQGREILDKLYRLNAEVLEIQTKQNNHSQILDNLQNLIDFEVEGSQLITRCDDLDIFYSYRDKILKAINTQLNHVKAIEQTIIREICTVDANSIAALPDWWERRLQSDIPQITLIFRSIGTRTYYKLNIPHPASTQKLSQPPIPGYSKGNHQAQIICLDNSKFIINCATKEESERVANIALSLISSEYKGSNPKLYFAERRGEAVQPGSMIATSAMYFPTGQKNTTPEWRVAFTRDGQ